MRRFFIVFVLLLKSVGASEIVDALYLIYGEDPSSSMVITWLSEEKETRLQIWLEKGWRNLTPQSKKMEDINLYVHRAVVEGLEPSKSYNFKIAPQRTLYHFRTAPKELKEDLVFAVGGDAYRFLSLFRKTAESIADKDPEFVVLGGDIAYTKGASFPIKGKGWESKRWQTFFREWFRLMKGKDGRLLPMIPVVGNHDVQSPETDPFFDLFYFPNRPLAYRNVDFGNYLHLVVLDTGHMSPVGGIQRDWLESSLRARAHFLYKVAAYHVGAYPSIYSYNGKKPKEIRDSWCPLFEEYGIKLCFEHHNHAYKRSFPIKAEKISEDGVTYVGDGAWGVEPRDVKRHRWYLAEAKAKNCFSLVTLKVEGQLEYAAFDGEGGSLDKMQTIAYEKLFSPN